MIPKRATGLSDKIMRPLKSLTLCATPRTTIDFLVLPGLG